MSRLKRSRTPGCFSVAKRDDMRMMAIIERELRRFFRSPALMMASMVFPLVQLIVLGNAFGGKITAARVAIVDQDGGPQALKIRQAFDAVRSTAKTVTPVLYS